MNKSRKLTRTDEIEVIGIDHGWSQMKTNSAVFSSGIREILTEPAFYDDVLEFDGRFYKVGTSREAVMENKVENDDYYFLTLAAIAKELEIRGKREATVVLAVGLPATRYGDEKEEFIKYLLRKEDVEFKFEQRTYKVKIKKVAVFPQCYAAVVDQLPTFGQKVVVVDIGSWTIDIIPIINKRPDDSNFNTLPEGLIPCMRSINKMCSRKLNEKLDEMDIQSYIMTKQTALGDEFKVLMDTALNEFSVKLFNSLREEGYGLKTTQFYFVGGGACVMKNFGGYEQSNIKYNLDVKANAKGFEKMAKIAMNAKRG